MTAAALIRKLADTGIRLSRRGDRLHVEGPPGSLTPELRATLFEAKLALLAELDGDTSGLSAIREHLRVLARGGGDALRLIDALPDAELAACAGYPVGRLAAYIRGLRDADMRQHGKRPDGETAAALCCHCGPVWLTPEVAAVAPSVNGWPVVVGCPWCHVKDRPRIPRPQVTSGECRHFKRDGTNPRDGAGGCRLGVDPARPWPNVARMCGFWRPLAAEVADSRRRVPEPSRARTHV